MAKRIILLLDGTWNDADTGDRDTNIVRMRELIAKTVGSAPQHRRRDGGTGKTNAETKQVHSFRYDGKRTHVYYHRGVGTGAFDRFRGGVLGLGLATQVRQAYRFLAYSYEPGDQVFIFGFSRGAYTARSLAGYVGAAGLLRREECTEPIEGAAWSYYRTSPDDRLSGDWVELGKHVHDRERLKLACVGVFDTVGALGVPLNPFKRINRDRYAFHDVNLNSIVGVNLQALAIDEQRKPFQAAIWRKPKFKDYDSRTEQVWFPGVHADVGGGYIPEERRKADYAHALDDITLDWMIKRLLNHFPDFPIDMNKWKAVDEAWCAAPQHDSRTWWYKFYRPAFRSIADRDLEPLPTGTQQVCWDRHASPVAEMVHVSALRRLHRKVDTGHRRKLSYRPFNLLRMVPLIRGTYFPDNTVEDPIDIRIVDWDGRDLSPGNAADVARAAEILPPE